MRLIVPFLPSVTFTHSIEELSVKADSLVKNRIDVTPWPEYEYKPNASFAIAHADQGVLLKYYVVEQNIRAVYSKPNEPVYKDTCVEFFISFGNETKYYNFEFNCIGTCRVGYGKNRTDRELLCDTVITKIKNYSVITSSNISSGANVRWELTVLIPFEVFCFHSFASLREQNCKVNFYKCGDDLPQPHFLAWNNIKSASPDFHLPEYFGEMKFE